MKHIKKTTIVIKVASGNGGREVWSIDPVTRVVRNRRVYDRKRVKEQTRKEIKNYV